MKTAKLGVQAITSFQAEHFGVQARFLGQNRTTKALAPRGLPNMDTPARKCQCATTRLKEPHAPFPKGAQLTVSSFSQLVRLARAADKDAFTELRARHQKEVNMVIFQVLSTAPDLSVRDCEQQAWVNAWRNIDRFAGSDNDDDCKRLFSAWVKQIAKNVATGEIRKHNAEKRGGNKIRLSKELDLLPNADPTPLNKLNKQEVAGIVWARLGDLDELSQRIVRLRCMEHMTEESVADILGLSRGKIRYQFNKALASLKKNVPSE